MKNCPHCNVKVGGNLEKCPLCQNTLSGEGERDHWPIIKLNTKRFKAFRIVTFAAIATCIINLALDYLFISAEHPSWSPIAVAWILVSGWTLESVIKRHYNLLQTTFLGMIAISFLCQISEFYIHLSWDVPYLGITSGYVIPILCSLNMVSNFVLSFIDKQFTDHSLIYMFLNILVGVVPWIALFFYEGLPPLTWSICMVINVLAFVALFVFKRRTVLSEFKKRFHI